MRWLLAIVVLAACGDGGAGPDAAAPDADPDSPWRRGPDIAGGAVQETAAVALDGRIYVIGGFNLADGITGAVRVFDVAASTWSDGEPLPAALHHGNAAVVDGVIYVLGSLRTSTFNASGAVWSYDPRTDAGWIERAPMPGASARGASVAGVVDGRIVVAGGFRDGASVADVSSYDPVGDVWDETVPDLPVARDHGCGGVIDGALYFAGGRLGPGNSRRLWVLEAGGWADRAQMITGRSGVACGVVGGELIVVGGEGNPDAASGVFPQTEAYDPVTDTWRALDPMPTPRHGMGAAAWEGSLYVPGGATRQGFEAVATFEILTP
jgi:N-acetylneuraminic acid mutarotase